MADFVDSRAWSQSFEVNQKLRFGHRNRGVTDRSTNGTASAPLRGCHDQHAMRAVGVTDGGVHRYRVSSGIEPRRTVDAEVAWCFFGRKGEPVRDDHACSKALQRNQIVVVVDEREVALAVLADIRIEGFLHVAVDVRDNEMPRARGVIGGTGSRAGVRTRR